MKLTAAVVVVSVVIATIYGLLFATIYPLVPIDGGIIGLCAVAGLATSLIGLGIWRAATKR